MNLDPIELRIIATAMSQEQSQKHNKRWEAQLAKAEKRLPRMLELVEQELMRNAMRGYYSAHIRDRSEAMRDLLVEELRSRGFSARIIKVGFGDTEVVEVSWADS